MHDIDLSVALVTRNRPQSLERTLRSLRGQKRQPAEVIVSDDSDAGEAEEVAKIVSRYDAQYLRGPRRGLYANRNYVALACRATHIRTMDDDHEFPPGHFEKCFEAMRNDPASIWIIGEHLPPEQHAAPAECPGQLHPRGFSVLPEDSDSCWAIADGAAIYPRTIFNRGLRLAERFRFGAAYLEFGSRLYWLGYRIRHLTTTYVIHHYDPSKRSFADVESELGSRAFAMLCHSFIYQPRLRNKMLSTAQLIREALVHPIAAVGALPRAFIEYRRQAQVCESMHRGPRQTSSSAAELL